MSKKIILTLQNEPKLELPEGPGLPIDHFSLTLDEHLALCEQMLPYLNRNREQDPDKNCSVLVPFVL